MNYLKKPIFEMHEIPELLAASGDTVGFLHFAEGATKSEIRELGWNLDVKARVLPDAQITLYTHPAVSGGLFGRIVVAAFAFWHARRAINDFRPDVIFSYGVPTNGWQLVLAAREAGIPVIFRAIDVSTSIRKTKFAPLVAIAERFVYRNSSWISANNPALLARCQGMGGDVNHGSVDLPPLDTKRFSTTHSNSSESVAQDILYMGSFFYFSGLPEVIKRFSEIAPDQMRLHLVGGGEQDLELRGLVEALGLEHKVIFHGFVDFNHLPEVFRLARVAINPMKKSEVSDLALPNKVLQYLASGLRVVSTELDGLSATIGAGDSLHFASSPTAVIEKAVEIALQSELLESEQPSVVALMDKLSYPQATDRFRKLLLRAVSNKA